MIIKSIIVDDEFKARNSLQKLLARYCEEVKIVASLDNVNDAEMAIRKYNPDVVFLDVEMPDYNGFDLLERFNSPDFEVIFTTAHPKFAINAFRYSAIDFLQKPIDFRLLTESVERYKQKTDNKYQKERYELLFQNMHFNPNSFNKITIPTREGFQFINVADIVCIKADRAYCDVHLLTGRVIIASKPLKDLEETLPNTLFYRCHKSYLINLNLCTEYVRSEDQIIMINKDIIPLASRSKSEFVTLLQERK